MAERTGKVDARNATLTVIAAGILWGLIGIPTKLLAAGGLDALQLTSVRMLFAAVMLWVFLAIRDPKKMKIRLRDVWMFFGTGVIGIGLTSLLYSFTTIESQASVAVVLMYTSPVFIMILSAILFRERITPVKIVALALCIAGCVLVTGMIGDAETITTTVLLTGVGSGLTFGLYTIFGRYALAKYHAMTVTAYSFLFATALQLPLSDVGGAVQILSAQPHLLIWLLLNASLCSVVPYLLYLWGLNRMENGTAAILSCVEPLVGAIVGILVFQEDHSVSKLLGIVLILVAIVLLSPRGDKKQT